MSRRLVSAVGLVCLVLGLATSTLVSVRQPLSLGDYVAIWGLKARALEKTGRLDSVFRPDPDGSFSHPEYPLLWPGLLAGTARLTGGYDELHLTLLRPLLLLAAAAFAVRATRSGAPFRLLAAGAVTLLPFFHEPGYAGYAEGLLAVWVLAALSEPLGSGSGRAPAIRRAIFWTLAAATKQEGLLAAVVAGGVLTASRRRRDGGLILSGAIGLAALPWALFRAAHDRSGALADFAASAFDPSKVFDAAAALLREAGLPGALWLLGSAAVLAAAPGTRARNRGVLAGMVLYSVLLLAAFAFTRRDPAWLVRWSWDRLAFLPALAMIPILAEAFSEVESGDSGGPTPHSK